MQEEMNVPAELEKLIEELSVHTLKLSQLVAEKQIHSPEYEESKNAVNRMTAEIEELKKHSNCNCEDSL